MIAMGGCVMRIDSEIAAASGVEETGQWPDPEPPPNARAIQRISTAFFMYCIRNMARVADNDLVVGLVYQAMWTANVKHITESATSIEYGGLDQIPPDAMRRPVSVMALANTLRMPHETIRRYVHILVKADRCVRVGNKGFIVPARAFERQDHKAAILEAWPSLLRMLDDLKRNEFNFEPYRRMLPNTVPLPPDGTPPANIRSILRVVVEMVMRGVDMMGNLHNDDFIYGLIFTAIATANVEHITSGPQNLKYGGLLQLPPDEMRRPVTVHAVALALQLPYETARRAANRVVRDGKALRIGNKGLIIPRDRQEKRDVYDVMCRSYSNVVRTVGDLHRSGFDFSNY